MSEAYSLRTKAAADTEAPDLPWRPPKPKRPLRIGVIGAGGIVASHLAAYRAAGWEVAAICNRTEAKARAAADEWYPQARVTSDYQSILADPAIEVVDVTPHPADRLPILEAAIRAGKHVLSQKPFVLDLADGERLAEMADAAGVRLAVNQNGRWAPHMAYAREVARAGLLGEVTAVHAAVHWDHGWVAGTPFDDIPELILHDFAIHWFDFLASVIGDRAEWVFASATRAAGQVAKPPLAAQAQVGWEGGQATLAFDGSVPVGAWDTTYVAGTEGAVRADGPDLNDQTVTITTAEGTARPALSGQWFDDGFRGAMGELMRAVEEGREPLNGARANLYGLALGFAAQESARRGEPVKVGSVTRAFP